MDWLGLRDFLIAGLIFVPVERVAALRSGQRIFRRGWLNDLLYVLFNSFLIKLALVVMVAVTIASVGLLMPPSWRAAVAAQPLWLQIVEMIVIGDIGFYCAHRAFHAIPSLWTFHQIHHSIEELDWLAAARVHPIDQIVTRGATLLPVFVLGFSDGAIAVYLVMYYWQSFLVHANVRIPFGPLRWLVASPEFHHWHHSASREAFNKNFAAQLPVIDWLLGTLHMPRGKAPERYGIDEAVPAGYLRQLVYPFKARGHWGAE